ncbi:MAG: 30S ribosomal protein S20 [Candidatus Euphemobacter frigidus]|nr:30S ribosomal protein S20 [Candidatus Euphemobacter frigidus]MDP8276536.1 30S ribosomal protein S20 [Candidatus Euphemobacter frigidus]
MPQSKSADKRLRQNIVRRKRNRALRSALKAGGRVFLEQLDSGDQEKTQAELRKAYSLLDRAVIKGVVKKNYAARKKSQLSRKLNSI